MECSRPGSSSDVAPRFEYEVFLSFRGPDALNGLADFLYHSLLDAGVRAFRDEEELRVGKEIDGILQHAITGCTIYIPIFSSGYADSAWCLRELAHMVDNASRSKGQKSILPIYFNVEPQDVRLETALYSDALLKHETRFPDEVKAWKAALAEVGKIEGWIVRKDQSHGAIIKSVVQEVVVKLWTKVRAETVIGFDDQIKDLTQLLDVNHPDVRLIGIYGMGGIGKTTVANVIFKQLSSHFGEYCSFLSGVREWSSTEDGIVLLQQKLLSDIGHFRSVEKINGIEEGMRMIGATLTNKKVLLILDDVDEKVHIKNLIANSKLQGGSRIIITTRNRAILQIEGFEGKIYRCKMQTMNIGHALELFCRHAFHIGYPSDDYREMSREIVSCIGRLPLAIVSIGSSLRNRDKEFWRETLDRLRKVPEDNTLKMLRISYDNLEYNQKQIFLDIACFFFNENKTDAIYMWDSCRFYPERAIEVLTNMSLIKISDDGKFSMHDRLIALGRQIVREESLGDLGKQSRLWIAEEALEIIRTKERKPKVQALAIDGLDDSMEITNEELERLPNLRFLKLGNGTFSGDFAKCLSKLRWISWCSPQQEFRADNLYLDDLVVFKLDKSGFVDDSKAWDLIKQASNLKVLSLTKCKGITTIPDFSKCLCLEKLTLARCDKLKGIGSSIRDLRWLIELEIEGCKNLAYLPEEVGTLVKLERFSLRGCHGLTELPSSLEYLQSLIELDLSHTAIAEPPNFIQGCDLRWIGRLSRLKKLELNLPNVRASPELAYLSHLKELTLGHLDLETLVQLPSSHWSLGNLSTLKFYQCEVEAIPLERLPQLEKLTVDGCGRLTRLSIPLELEELRQAQVFHCPELVEIQVVGGSKSLKTLRVLGCESLERIGGLSCLKNLEDLEIQQCSVLTNLEGLRELESLKSLVVKDSTSLRWRIDASSTDVSDDCPAEIEERGDFIIHGAASQLSDEDILRLNEMRHLLPQYTPESIEILEDESGQPPVDVESLYSWNPYSPVPSVVGIDDHAKQITDLTEVEVDDESMEKMKDEDGQRPEDMETSDRNYAIAAVQNIVGIDGHVKQITDLLEMEVNDEVRILGIFGTDGIGKTTLAKAVYDRISCCFDNRSFLAEVEETTQDPHGIKVLETKLIRDILEQDHVDPSFDERIEDFLDIFREREVLLVVDEVEEQSHLREIVGDKLHRFGPGSRIIVTSQNERILEGYEAEKVRTYRVGKMDDGQAFELFCEHAFRMQSPIPDYAGVANRIVNATEKLPLAVEVVGSFLRGKSIQEWKRMEKSMKELTRSSRKIRVGLEEVLDICCKELDQQQKDIFLDIAGFISGVDARIASYMWPNCYLPSSGCILMPLAKTGENNELQMHRLLRCLGKRILKQKGSGDPTQRIFCTQDMVLKAMKRETGMENVEALCFDFKAGDFQSMPNIRFLKLDNAKFSGNFAGAFACLRWLCWQRCPPDFSAENLALRELVILDLSWSKVTEDWGGWRKIEMENLKVLNLTGCSDLLFTPDFSCYKNLEILILEGCSRLVKLDPSIGHLKRLISLNVKFCSQLNGLPVELGCVTALKELLIDRTSVRQIPTSIGNLKQLEILSGFECFPLTRLPSSICYLTLLSKLSLDGARITELPSSLGDLLKLRRLSLRDCRYLEKLPCSIGEMGSLEELDISATSISELPSSIRNLESLKVLRLDSSFIRAFPGEIGNLTNLEELHASWCLNLKGTIPSNIEGLCNLRSLMLGHSSISSLPPEISTVPGLRTLDLSQCNEIEDLPKLPPSLIHLRVSSKRLKATPLLDDLKELEELCLSDSDPKAGRPPSKRPMPESDVINEQSFSILFPKLRKLELSLSQVIKLKFELTDIRLLKRLKTLTPPGLSHKEEYELPKMLSVLKLYDSAIEEIEGLEGLEALKRLDISNCKIQNLHGIGLLTSLRNLILSDCNDLSSLDLSNLKSLKVLEIRRCKMIRQIEGLEKLTSLEKLNISECPAENSVQVRHALKHVLARSTVK